MSTLALLLDAPSGSSKVPGVTNYMFKYFAHHIKAGSLNASQPHRCHTPNARSALPRVGARGGGHRQKTRYFSTLRTGDDVLCVYPYSSTARMSPTRAAHMPHSHLSAGCHRGRSTFTPYRLIALRACGAPRSARPDGNPCSPPASRRALGWPMRTSGFFRA